MSKKITFTVESFRKIPNPYKAESASVPQMYEAIVDVTKMPGELLEWMETNPRKQNINGKVGKKIKASLLTGDNNFHLLNRGLLISAEEVEFSNYDNSMKVFFSDPECHGDVDGGHTLRVIMENKDALEEGQQFVKVEILTGVESFFEDLAEARNTSTQVKDESIANLKDYFDLIKRVVDNEPFKDRINYVENDDGDIDISDILALLFMFNIKLYPSMDSCPVTAYSSKKKCVDTYISEIGKIDDGALAEEDSVYFKMQNIIPDIFALYDQLESKIGDYYLVKNPGGRYGATTGVTTAKDNQTFTTKFFENEIKYYSPKGFLYPIIGAFRALVCEENGVYTWGDCDPFAILDKIGPELVATTVERSRQNGNNPNKTGKDSTLWQPLYMRVMMEKMMAN